MRVCLFRCVFMYVYLFIGASLCFISGSETRLFILLRSPSLLFLTSILSLSPPLPFLLSYFPSSVLFFPSYLSAAQRLACISFCFTPPTASTFFFSFPHVICHLLFPHCSLISLLRSLVHILKPVDSQLSTISKLPL